MPAKLTFVFVKEEFEKRNCKLLSTEYINGKELLKFISRSK